MESPVGTVVFRVMEGRGDKTDCVSQEAMLSVAVSQTVRMGHSVYSDTC